MAFLQSWENYILIPVEIDTQKAKKKKINREYHSSTYRGEEEICCKSSPSLGVAGRIHSELIPNLCQQKAVLEENFC